MGLKRGMTAVADGIIDRSMAYPFFALRLLVLRQQITG